jgi:hypothetical protein
MPASFGVFVTDEERSKLEALVRSGKTEQRLLRRIIVPCIELRANGISIWAGA